MKRGIEAEQRDAFEDSSLGSLDVCFLYSSSNSRHKYFFFIFSDSINPIHPSSSNTQSDIQLFLQKWTTPDILSCQHIDSASSNPPFFLNAALLNLELIQTYCNQKVTNIQTFVYNRIQWVKRKELAKDSKTEVACLNVSLFNIALCLNLALLQAWIIKEAGQIHFS